MIVGTICQSRTFPLIKVPSKVEVDANFYVNFVLKPLINKYLINHFKQDINKVTIHCDKANSHTANRTKEFMEEMDRKHGISFLDKKDIPVRGADISPMDFFGSGYLKQEVEKSRARTESGVWKAIEPITCEEIFMPWKRRLRTVASEDGEHIEHIHNTFTDVK